MDGEDPSAVRTEQPNRHAELQRIREKRMLTDALCRFELFLLGDGEKKVTEEVDTRMFSPSIISSF